MMSTCAVCMHNHKHISLVDWLHDTVLWSMCTVARLVVALVACLELSGFVWVLRLAARSDAVSLDSSCSAASSSAARFNLKQANLLEACRVAREWLGWC